MLAEYPEVLVKAAFKKWVKTERKMPTPADIISMIEEDNARLLDLVGYVRQGGNISENGERFVSEKLGNNWKNIYV